MINRNHTIAAMLSQAAYFDYGTIKKMFGRKFDSITFFSGKSTQAYLFLKDETVFITFRGTEATVEDIKTDLNYKKEYVESIGYVHAGFWNALKEISNKMLKALGNHKDKNIHLTGHSLGGALALLFGIILHVKKVGFSGIYTFGQPRVFSKKTARCIEKKIDTSKILRFVNNKDIVPRIPLYIQGFSHIGQVYFFDEKSKIHFDVSLKDRIFMILQDLCVSNLFFVFSPWHIFTKVTNEMIGDHKMDRYLKLTFSNFYMYSLAFLIPGR